MTAMKRMTKEEKNRMLEEAVWSNNFSDAKKALELGADPNTRGVNNKSLLIIAFGKGNKGNMEILRLLIEYGADVNIKNIINGNTLLSEVVMSECDDKVGLLLDNTHNKIDLNGIDKYGNTALHYAAHFGLTKTIRLLLDHGADPDMNGRSYDGTAPLHRAINMCHCEAVKAFIEAGSDLNIRDTAGLTPLMYCALRGYIEIMDILADAGADLNIKNTQGDTALDMLKRVNLAEWNLWAQRFEMRKRKKILQFEDSGQLDQNSEPDFSI